MPRIKAIIFDFDGVLFDTEPLHYAAFHEILRSEGIVLSPERYQAVYIGLTDKACFRAVIEDHKKSAASDADLNRLVRRKTDLMQFILSERLPRLPGVLEFVREARLSHRLAIASGALIQEIVLCLQLAGLMSAFEHVTSAEDVPHGKPDPAPYLHALQALDRRSPLRADECVAFEDTPRGIEAAHKAGMRCIGVAHTLPVACLAQADVVIPSLQHASWASLVAQLAQ